jgi:hypothetical protein
VRAVPKSGQSTQKYGSRKRTTVSNTRLACRVAGSGVGFEVAFDADVDVDADIDVDIDVDMGSGVRIVWLIVRFLFLPFCEG